MYIIKHPLPLHIKLNSGNYIVNEKMSSKYYTIVSTKFIKREKCYHNYHYFLTVHVIDIHKSLFRYHLKAVVDIGMYLQLNYI